MKLKADTFKVLDQVGEIRTSETDAIDRIEYEPLDDEKIKKKIDLYIKKGYGNGINDMLVKLLTPWNKSINKFIVDVTEQEKQSKGQEFSSYWAGCCLSEDLDWLENFEQQYIEKTLRPYLDIIGMQDVKVWKNDKWTDVNVLDMEYNGFATEYACCSNKFYPSTHFTRLSFPLPHITPLATISRYLKLMPTICRQADDMVITALRYYDQLMHEDEVYRKVVELLEPLAKQYSGTPVGKFIKYLRWSIVPGEPYYDGRTRLFILSLEVINDREFSCKERTLKGYDSNNNAIYEGVVKELWLDSECHTVYAGDPETTDVKEWRNTHTTYGIPNIWSWCVGDFVPHFFNLCRAPFLSIDFIDQKL